MVGPSGEIPLPDSLRVGAIVGRAGPRLVRDGFGPLLMFFAGWKLFGLGVGIAAAATFGVAVFLHERRSGRPGMVVRLALVLVAIRATVGISSGSASTYLAQEVGIDTVLGTAVLLTLLTPVPFAARFSQEIYPLPPQMRDSDAFRGAMRTITLTWGVYFLTRGLVRLIALLTMGTDEYVLVAAVSDAPFLIALLAWSVYYTAATFRRSPQWGPLIQAAEVARAGVGPGRG